MSALESASDKSGSFEASLLALDVTQLDAILTDMKKAIDEIVRLRANMSNIGISQDVIEQQLSTSILSKLQKDAAKVEQRILEKDRAPFDAQSAAQSAIEAFEKYLPKTDDPQ